MKNMPLHYVNTSDRDVPLYPTAEQVGNDVCLRVQTQWREEAKRTDADFDTASGLCIPLRMGLHP